MAGSFTPDIFAFLRDLATNNNRAWFHENKQRFEDSVRQPALDFITDFVEPLETLSPHFVADSRTVGGSLFRIHRDTRFSKDKTPYKLNTGMHFRHERAKDAHRAWLLRPPRTEELLHRCRALDARTDGRPSRSVSTSSNTVTSGRRPRSTPVSPITSPWGGDQLKRPPRGIDLDPDDPLMEDLRRKSFIATSPLTQGAVTKGDFAQVLLARFNAAGPMMRLLCDAVGV